MSRPGQAINLPPRVQSGMAITAAQFNAIRESIARLARSGVPDGPKVYPRRYDHPWRITVDSDLRLEIYFAAVHVVTWPDTFDFPTIIPISVSIGGAFLLGDEFNVGTGFIQLAHTNDYGIWLRAGNSTSNPTAPSSEFDSVLVGSFAGSAEVIASTSKIEKTDVWDEDGNGYFYIGKIEVDADSNAAITQNMKSDLLIPLAYTLPETIIHPEETPP